MNYYEDFLDFENGEFRLWESGGYEDTFITVSKEEFIEALKKHIEKYQKMLAEVEALEG